MSPATFEELFRGFFRSLEAGGSPYFAYGGIAVAVWGAPRETVDVDVVVCLAASDLPDLLLDLERAGFRSSSGQKKTFPIDGWIRVEYRGRHADLALGRTPFDESALARRRRVELFGLPIWIASAEDVILYKLVAHRYKDLGDAEAIVQRMGARLDHPYLRHWADEIARGTGKFEVPGRLEEFLDRSGE